MKICMEMNLNSTFSPMKKYIEQLAKQKTWEQVNCNNIPTGPDGKHRRVIKGTWAFKLKRLPDGSPLKYKAIYCM